jgi:hypothetical protein
MNVKIGTEAAQFPEKEYINWIFLAVQLTSDVQTVQCTVYNVHIILLMDSGQRLDECLRGMRGGRRGRGGRDRDLSLLLRQSTGDPLGRRTVYSEAAAYSLSGAKVARVLLPKALLQEDRSFNRKELYRSFLADELRRKKVIFY